MRATLLLATACISIAGPAAAQSGPEKIVARPAADPSTVNTVADAVRAIPPAPPEKPAGAAPVMPASNPGSWVRTEDYPAWAVRYDVSGRVGFTVEVGTNGRVTRCDVTRSSGVPDLDAIACEKVTERARFVPARNQFGEPVPGSWATTVVWQLDDGELNDAPQPGFLVVTMVVEPDGRVSDCRIERAEGEAAEFPLDECGEGQRFEPILDADGNPQRTRIRMMARLVHEQLP
jgi:protein TonB